MREHSREYRDYLRSPEWKQTRAAALRQAHGVCERCVLPRYGLQVHHVSYDRLGHEEDEDLAVLCPDCHRASR
jgi:5-methylcytosine-specific restriction endonuclease McrA